MEPVAPPSDFPALAESGRREIYADSAAMTLRPYSVIDAVSETLRSRGANVHRARYGSAEAATEAFESARSSIASFFGVRAMEIAFTSNTTEGLNQVAVGLSLPPGSEVLVSAAEHHSNLLPWGRVAAVRRVPLDDDGRVSPDVVASMITSATKVIAIGHGSNVTGALQPVEAIASLAREYGVLSVVDGAQTAGHIPVDLGLLGCDFYACSGHKMFGPSGIGVLYGRDEALARLQPLQVGGGMVADVRATEWIGRPSPRHLEAGTPPVEAAIGLAAAVDYLEKIGRSQIAEYNESLARHLRRRLDEAGISQPLAPGTAGLPVATIVPERDDVDPALVAMTLADSWGIAVRDGLFCCQPLFDDCGIRGGIRISLHAYNSHDEIDRIVEALERIGPLLR